MEQADTKSDNLSNYKCWFVFVTRLPGILIAYCDLLTQLGGAPQELIKFIRFIFASLWPGILLTYLRHAALADIHSY